MSPSIPSLRPMAATVVAVQQALVLNTPQLLMSKIFDSQLAMLGKHALKPQVPEMHFIMKTRRFAHFIMKTPAGKRPIPPKPMSTKGLTKPAHQQQLFHRARAPVVQKNSRVFSAIPGVFSANSRKILGLFLSMFFTHKKPSLMHLGLLRILKIYKVGGFKGEMAISSGKPLQKAIYHKTPRNASLGYRQIRTGASGTTRCKHASMSSDFGFLQGSKKFLSSPSDLQP